VDEAALRQHLRAAYPRENEACEWKEFKNLKHAISGKAGDDVVSYVSAIANMTGGHLVLGVADKTLAIVGIKEFGDYTVENVRHRIAGHCAHLNSEKLRIEEIRADDSGKIVWIIHIPQHEARLPVNAHGKPWQRVGDALVAMRPERLKVILAEPIIGFDWSAQVVDGATVSDLDEAALQVARDKFKEKNASQSWKHEVDRWDVITFLDKCRLAANRGITRAALLLLGRPEAARLLSPHPAQITWKLETEDRAYEHFGPPFILSTTEVSKRIRNFTQRLFPANQLLGVDIQKYDTLTILEALHNCIAHQDYERCERIVVIETPDRLIFENAGAFIDGAAEDYLNGRRTPRRYRNPWLAQAMVEVKMIDTVGYGIHRMTTSQRSRYLPLPDYGRSSVGTVVLEVLGRPIDERYSQLLLERSDLDIDAVILLDRVQKKLPITDEAVARLRRDGLIEGRKPNFVVAAAVAKATETEASNMRDKGTEKAHLKRFVLDHLERFGEATRNKLDALLLPMLAAGLSDRQKRDRVKNLLSEMRSKDGSIISEGFGPGAAWKLAKGD
jgi:ATP-dependent DNA helicase RecG